MKNGRIELGTQGENLAVQFLQKQGYKILQRNFRSRHGEIDIICARAHIIAFVEVKTRTTASYGSPEEAITKTKKQHIQKVALDYLETCPQSFQEIRFDVIGIFIEGGRHRINHLPAAF
ncbi:MAG: YraN family protein [Syntrophomonadaceae bacterium]|nr:YraN family protein [Syntrophomonadaceae bacterium]